MGYVLILLKITGKKVHPIWIGPMVMITLIMEIIHNSDLTEVFHP
jgi:hypothetical protein